MENKQYNLVQEIECPYGASTLVRIQDEGRGLTIQCMYALESVKDNFWADRRMEKILEQLGCPKPSGRTRKFRNPECPLNEGILKRL